MRKSDEIIKKCMEVKLMNFRGIRLLILAQFILSTYLVAAAVFILEIEFSPF